MNDGEMIKAVWLTIPKDMRENIRTEYGGYIRGRPIQGVQPATQSGLEPVSEMIEVIEFAAAPFNTVIGRWRGVVVLVQVP